MTNSERIQANNARLRESIETAKSLPEAGGTDGGGVSGIYLAKVTLPSAEPGVEIIHNLGTTDIRLAAMWIEDGLGDIVPSNNDVLSSVWTATEIPNNRNAYGNSWVSVYSTANNNVSNMAPTSGSYWNAVLDENTFKFAARTASAARYVASVTYTVVIVAGDAFSATEV